MKYKDSLCVNADGSAVDLTPQVGDLVELTSGFRAFFGGSTLGDSICLWDSLTSMTPMGPTVAPLNCTLVSREGCKPKESRFTDADFTRKMVEIIDSDLANDDLLHAFCVEVYKYKKDDHYAAPQERPRLADGGPQTECCTPIFSEGMPTDAEIQAEAMLYTIETDDAVNEKSTANYRDGIIRGAKLVRKHYAAQLLGDKDALAEAEAIIRDLRLQLSDYEQAQQPLPSDEEVYDFAKNNLTVHFGDGRIDMVGTNARFEGAWAVIKWLRTKQGGER